MLRSKSLNLTGVVHDASQLSSAFSSVRAPSSSGKDEGESSDRSDVTEEEAALDEEEAHLAGMGQDALREIFAKLDARSLARCSQTCNRMKRICDEPALWQGLFLVRERGQVFYCRRGVSP